MLHNEGEGGRLVFMLLIILNVFGLLCTREVQRGSKHRQPNKCTPAARSQHLAIYCFTAEIVVKMSETEP
jgi:hypothetical protein